MPSIMGFDVSIRKVAWTVPDLEYTPLVGTNFGVTPNRPVRVWQVGSPLGVKLNEKKIKGSEHWWLTRCTI